MIKFKYSMILAIISCYFIFVIASLQTFLLIGIIITGNFSFFDNIKEVTAPIFMLFGLIGGIRLNLQYIKYKRKH